MVNIGIVQSGTAPHFEDEASLKQWIRKQPGYLPDSTTLVRSIINQAGTADAVELAEKGGLTISQKTAANATIVLASDTDDNAYDGHTVTGHYYTLAGVKSTFTAAYDTTDTTTEVQCCTDFLCWNLDDYTAATVLVSSVAVQAGDNVYVGLTGMVAGAEKRYATIAAAATYPVITTLFSTQVLYGLEEANTAGDVGKIVYVEYVTAWGLIKTCSITLAADTTTIVRAVDSTNGRVVQDFYRVRKIYCSTALGKYYAIGMDADKLVGIAAVDVFYGVIEEGYSTSMHTAYFVPARDAWLTEICINNSVGINLDTYLTITYTAYGETVARTCKVALPNNQQTKMMMMMQLKQLSDLSFTILGNLSDNTFDIHIIEAVAKTASTTGV